MQYQTVTILTGNSLFEVIAALELSDSHTAATPDRWLAGWIRFGQSLREVLEEFHFTSLSEKTILIDDCHNHYRIVEVEQERERVRFVAELIVTVRDKSTLEGLTLLRTDFWVTPVGWRSRS